MAHARPSSQAAQEQMGACVSECWQGFRPRQPRQWRPPSQREHLLRARPSSVASRRHVVICLGQSLEDEGRVPRALEIRVTHAIAVYRRLAAEGEGVCFYVSGNDVAGWVKSSALAKRGRDAEEYEPEGAVMQTLMMQQGVDVEDIDVDTDAFNTIENATNAVAFIRARHARAVTLVTSDFHSPRALYIFKSVFRARGAQDLNLVSDPADSGLADGPIRQRQPLEINDFNFAERVHHETSLMRNRMKDWLMDYQCPTEEEDFDEALLDLQSLAARGTP